MSRFRKLQRQAQKEYDLKIKRQKTLFSLWFILTVAVSFLMLIICAVNNGPTLATTAISGSAWLTFDLLYAYALKHKWPLLFDECSTGRFSYDYTKTEAQQKEDNWQGNCVKFVIAVTIFLLHLVLFFFEIG